MLFHLHVSVISGNTPCQLLVNSRTSIIIGNTPCQLQCIYHHWRHHQKYEHKNGWFTALWLYHTVAANQGKGGFHNTGHPTHRRRPATQQSWHKHHHGQVIISTYSTHSRTSSSYIISGSKFTTIIFKRPYGMSTLHPLDSLGLLDAASGLAGLESPSPKLERYFL